MAVREGVVEQVLASPKSKVVVQVVVPVLTSLRRASLFLRKRLREALPLSRLPLALQRYLLQ